MHKNQGSTVIALFTQDTVYFLLFDVFLGAGFSAFFGVALFLGKLTFFTTLFFVCGITN